MNLKFGYNHKVLVANRGEIAIRILRAASELSIPTVAIYAFEDRFSDHHQYASESTMIAQEGEFAAMEAYLQIQRIVDIAKKHNVTMIHPGYGLLSEDENFARAIEEAGMIFVGPPAQVLGQFGSKTSARQIAKTCGVPTVPGTSEAVKSPHEVSDFIEKHGLPVLIKASHGGGGRGQRIVDGSHPSEDVLAQAQSEARHAFGNDAVFLEKFLQKPKHIEVQILADKYGNVVHLFERDCTVQRRHQKIVELAPAPSLPAKVRTGLHQDAIRIAKEVNYENAGTVEFLVENDRYYFIEVNPRIQVEHTVTEAVCDVDLVKSQFQIAMGHSLADLQLVQERIQPCGFAIQCRVTSEIPSKDFRPSSGKIEYCHVPTGPRVRVDGYNLFSGAQVTPYFDPLLFKCITHGSTFEAATKTMERALQESRIIGVETNISFLLRILQDGHFTDKTFWTRWLDTDRSLQSEIGHQREEYDTTHQKLLKFFAEGMVNGNMIEGQIEKPTYLGDIQVRGLKDSSTHQLINTDIPCREGWRNIIVQRGPAAFAQAVRKHSRTLLTDTTWRDAHQSHLATRVRTIDFANIARHTSHAYRSAYSLECWGGATFDVALRFLYEDPWARLRKLRKLAPNIPFQMLLRGVSGLAYSALPDNFLEFFTAQAVKNGVDIIRVFDGLNDIANLEAGIKASLRAGAVVEAAILYTGNMMEPGNKYSLEYYMDLVDKLVQTGAHVISVKSMSGVMKPEAGRVLVSSIRRRYPDIPIHMHTHDAAGTGVATMLSCVEGGADIIDTATDSLSGTTSQPAITSTLAGLADKPHEPEFDFGQICAIDSYWAQVRLLYSGFDAKLTAPDPDVYLHEIPGGQLSNLIFQARQLGLGEQWRETKDAFVTANALLGNIVKATPTSKAVGDFAQFLVNKRLSYDDVIAQAETLDFPASVLDFFQGLMGQPLGGFPEPLRTQALRGHRLKIDGRTGEYLSPIDFIKVRNEMMKEYGSSISDCDIASYIMFPDVFAHYKRSRSRFGDLSSLPSRWFLVPPKAGDVIEFDIREHETLRIKVLALEPFVEGKTERDVFFLVNGQHRHVTVADIAATPKTSRRKVNALKASEIGAPLAGKITKVLVSNGDDISKGQVAMVISAMKMELNISASCDGTVSDISVEESQSVEQDDCLFEIV